MLCSLTQLLLSLMRLRLMMLLDVTARQHHYVQNDAFKVDTKAHTLTKTLMAANSCNPE